MLQTELFVDRSHPVEVEPDWSTLVTQIHRALTKAEDELRLIHMSSDYTTKARAHIWKAQAYLLQLDQWCKDES